MFRCLAYKLFFIALLVVSAPSIAGAWGEWSLDLNGLSRHSESRYSENGLSKKYNESNPGFGVTLEWSAWSDLVQGSSWTRKLYEYGIDADIKFGFFDNSYDETSFYAGPFFHKDLGSGSWKFAPGIALLLTTGYDDTPQDAPVIFPLPVLGLELGHQAVKVNIGYVPWGDVDLVTLQLQIVPDRW